MEKETQSHNSIGITPRQFIVPNLQQILLYITLGVILLIILNLGPIWDALSRALLLEPQDVRGIVASGRNQEVSQLSDSILQGRLPQILFWILIGCLTYIIIWFMRSILTNIRNDIVADEYTHPRSYNRASFWQSVILRKTLFASMAVLLGTYIYANFRLLPLLAKISYSAIDMFQPLSSTLEILGAIAATALLIHLFILLIHFTVNLWLFIYSDL